MRISAPYPHSFPLFPSSPSSYLCGQAGILLAYALALPFVSVSGGLVFPSLLLHLPSSYSKPTRGWGAIRATTARSTLQGDESHPKVPRSTWSWRNDEHLVAVVLGEAGRGAHEGT